VGPNILLLSAGAAALLATTMLFGGSLHPFRAVIMNSAVMELPSDMDGRFWPFVTGGLVYALMLVPLA
jgi:hypothetical protein